MNKGLRYLFCKQCKRKRYCKSIPIGNHNFKKICSKGHEWIVEGFTIERIESAMKATFNSDKLKNLFERDNAFFRRFNN